MVKILYGLLMLVSMVLSLLIGISSLASIYEGGQQLWRIKVIFYSWLVFCLYLYALDFSNEIKVLKVQIPKNCFI